METPEPDSKAGQSAIRCREIGERRKAMETLITKTTSASIGVVVGKSVNAERQWRPDSHRIPRPMVPSREIGERRKAMETVGKIEGVLEMSYVGKSVNAE